MYYGRELNHLSSFVPEREGVNDYRKTDIFRFESIEGRKFYSATDTGFISQNVYLFCASEGLSTVVLGWIDRPALSKLMKLEDHQSIILTQPVGYPQ